MFIVNGLIALALSSGLTKATYAPVLTQCPTDIQLVRSPRGLSEAEAEWVHGRKTVASRAFLEYLQRANLTDFDLATYGNAITSESDWAMPTLAMANSGGGWRAALTGVGALKAFDALSSGSNEAGTGGLLQSLTYYAGLSGGGWPVSSLALYNYPAVEDLVQDWRVDISRISAENDTQYAATFETMFKQIYPKFEAGFNVSVSDLLGRAFAYEYVPGAEGGLETTFSSIQNLSNFKNFSGPMPLLQANSIEEEVSSSFYGVYVPLENSTIYTWSPFEFGSFDTGFTPTQYVGSRLSANGSAIECVEGLDRASFVLASVASAYNYWWIGAVSNGTLGGFSKRGIDYPSRHKAKRTPVSEPATHAYAKRDSPFNLDTIESLNQAFNETFNLTLAEIANPSFPVAFDTPNENPNVTLADGSEALQSLPFWSLIAPERNVDFIIAWDDDSDDTPYAWNNGTNMCSTSMFAKEAGIPFPTSPSPETFLARNLSLRPTFFGCDIELTTSKSAQSPIVLYLANAPYSWYSNFSWGTTNMSYAELDGVLTNSLDLVSQGNGTLDAEWPACIACAAVERSLARVNMSRTEQCNRCFAKYCWDGEEAAPGTWTDESVFDPSMVLMPDVMFEDWVETHPFSD